jgi:hypothetical protein
VEQKPGTKQCDCYAKEDPVGGTLLSETVWLSGIEITIAHMLFFYKHKSNYSLYRAETVLGKKMYNGGECGVMVGEWV